MKSVFSLFMVIFLCDSCIIAQGDTSSGSKVLTPIDNQLKKDALSREVHMIFDDLPFDSSVAFINDFCIRNGYRLDTTSKGGPQYVKTGGSFDYVPCHQDSMRRFNRYMYSGQKKANGDSTESDDKRGILVSRGVSVFLRYNGNGNAVKRDFRKITARLKKAAPYTVYLDKKRNYGGPRYGNALLFYWDADRKHSFLEVQWRRGVYIGAKAWLAIDYVKLPPE